MEAYTEGQVCHDCAENDTRLLREHNATLNDGENGEGFTDYSRHPCDTCGDKLHGARYTVAFWH
jgi:hypothetical protein